MTRQREFDWTIASMRRLLTRAAKALKGQSIATPGSTSSKDRVGGRTLAKILDGVFAWSIATDGQGKSIVTSTRWRPVAELVPELDLRTIRKGLSVLRSPEARECVAAKEGRLGQSPAIDLWIAWTKLEEWAELLEAGGSSSSVTVPREMVHGAARYGSQCRGVTVQGEAASLSTVPRRHRPLYDGSERIGTKETSSLPVPASGSVEEEFPEADQRRVETDLKASKRRELVELLRQELEVDLAEELADQAGELCGLDHAFAVARYAIEREIRIETSGNAGVLRPWGPGAVFRRLSKPGVAQLPVERGWAEPEARWSQEWARRAARREREAESGRASLRDSVERMERAELESRFGGLVDALSPRDQVATLPIEWRVEIKSREDLSKPMIRVALLRSAAVRELSKGEESKS